MPARGRRRRAAGQVDVGRQGAGVLVGQRGAAGQREEGQPRAQVLAVADVVGVHADVEPGRRGQQRLGADAAGVAARVPAQRDAGARVERRDPRAGHGTGAGGVAAVGVVHPALVTADVDRRAGDGDGEQRVAAGVGDPSRRDRLPGGGGLPAARGVAERPGVGAAGGDDDEVGAVRRELDVAHPAVEAVASCTPTRSSWSSSSRSTTAPVGSSSTIIAWSRTSPSACRKLPMTIIRLPSGVTSKFSTPIAALAVPRSG